MTTDFGVTIFYTFSRLFFLQVGPLSYTRAAVQAAAARWSARASCSVQAQEWTVRQPEEKMFAR